MIGVLWGTAYTQMPFFVHEAGAQSRLSQATLPPHPIMVDVYYNGDSRWMDIMVAGIGAPKQISVVGYLPEGARKELVAR